MVRVRVTCTCLHVIMLVACGDLAIYIVLLQGIPCMKLIFVFLSEPTFRVPTEMTPENFHDFLSLASSPPLRSSMPPHPLDTHPESRQSQQERGVSNGNDENCDQCGEADEVLPTPSFAQVRNPILLINV